MPITFGAVGDIISVCLLVKDLVDALDKTRGSKAEYQSLTQELRILDRVLLEIDLLARRHERGITPELEALCKTARKAVDRCNELVSDFLQRIKKYQSTLEGNGTKPNFVKETAMKLRWRIGEKDAVEKFRVEIAGTSASLQMLLATASVTLMDINKKKLDDHISGFQQQNATSLSKQDAVLLSIQDRIEDTNRLISDSTSTTSKIVDALRLDWLRQLGAELRGYMRRIIAMNIATYHAVISIQMALPSHLERGLIQEPFILEDAIGRVAPVHLQFVTSWDAFNAVLEIRFRDIQGFKKVQHKQYGLQEKATGRDIDQSRSWDRAFLPGQRIDMSFICNWKNSGDSKGNGATCPGCQVLSASLTDVDIQCNNCQMWFRRITIIENVDPPPHTPVPTPWRSKSEFGKSGFTGTVSGPVRPGKRRLVPNDVDGDDDPRGFKRVRMISKKRQIKQRQFGNIRANGDLKTFSSLSNASSPAISTFHFPMPEIKTPMVPGAVTAKPEASKEVLLDRAEVMRRDLETARQMGLLKVLKAESGLDLSVPHSEPLNNRIFSTSTQTNEPDSPPHTHDINPCLDMLLCYECSSKWRGYERGFTYPECRSGFTKLIEGSVGSQRAFSRAAEGGCNAVVKTLLETGKVDLNWKDWGGRTPVSWAASNGHEAVVKMLLETGKVDLNLRDRYGYTPLSWAALNGHEVVVKMLLETGKVEVNLEDMYGWTPLSWAELNRHDAVVKMLQIQSR